MKNLTLKIACAVVAVLVWIQVAATTMVEADVSLPMEIVGLGDDWTVAGSSLPQVAHVRLRAAKLALMANNYFGVPLGSVQMDLANYQPGPPVLYVLKESDVRTEAEVVTLLPPVRLPLRIDWLDHRRLPVRVPLRGQLAIDRLLAGPVTAVPDSVTVTGPRRFFRGVDSLLTEPVDLAGLTATLARDLPITPPPQPLSLGVATVRVNVPITRLDERVVANIPVLAEAGGRMVSAGISPPVCDVLVRGPADSVAALTPAQLRVTVPVAGLGPGVHQVIGRVRHPDWVIAVGLEPEGFMVIIDGEPPAEQGLR
ncbi:MAG: hypothetical protein R3D98_08670 [Candidatus Krumholzibacteriia bacterium]